MRRRAVLAVAAVAVAVATGCGSQGPTRTEAGSSEASGQRTRPDKQVRDERAGVVYAIAGGWRETPRDDLVGFFSSAIAFEGKAEGEKAAPSALVGAGLFQNTSYDPRGGLREAAVASAQGFAEFLIPSSGREPVRSDNSIKIDGVEAWRADYSVDPDDAAQQRSAVTVIAVGGLKPFFLVAALGGGDAELEREVETILASAKVLPVSGSPPSS